MANLPLFDFGSVNTDPITPWTPPASVPAVPPTPRWYVRCTDCLTIAAVTERPNVHAWQCAACNGQIESMGRVERDRLVHEHHASPCDDRCTNARGPHCDCKCGGKNHGSKRTVRIITDAGPVPRVAMPQPEQARYRAQAYRDARARVLAQLDPLTARRSRGEFLPSSQFAKMRALQAALRSSHAARSHTTRIRTLTAALAL